MNIEKTNVEWLVGTNQCQWIDSSFDRHQISIPNEHKCMSGLYMCTALLHLFTPNLYNYFLLNIKMKKKNRIYTTTSTHKQLFIRQFKKFLEPYGCRNALWCRRRDLTFIITINFSFLCSVTTTFASSWAKKQLCRYISSNIIYFIVAFNNIYNNKIITSSVSSDQMLSCCDNVSYIYKYKLCIYFISLIIWNIFPFINALWLE